MMLLDYMNSQFSAAQNLDFCLRVVIAAVFGGILGFERSRRFKSAGVRTHIVVCCTACLMMIVSKYGFADLTGPDGASFNGTRGADSARIAAQVVSGISFLCAGVIFKDGGSIKGLTTAAGIWLTAGLGLAIGSGMVVTATFALVFLYALQKLMHRFAVGADAYAGNRLQFTVKNGYDFNSALEAQLKEWNAVVTDSKVTRRQEEGVTEYNLVVRRHEEISYAEIKNFMAGRNDILAASNSPLR